MIDINIDVPRPWQTLAVLGAVAWMIAAVTPGRVAGDAIGGGTTDQAKMIAQAQQETQQLREEQQVITRWESILRGQLETLQSEARDHGDDPAVLAAVDSASQRLRLLLADKRQVEDELRSALDQLWKAEGRARTLSQRRTPVAGAMLQWPFTPRQGLSAVFHDSAYAQRFGVAHQGIDIPTPQGTALAAAADGVVLSAIDNGYGFSSVTMQSDDGLTYLYGHVSTILVREGQRVRFGDIVAKSGGLPGTPGAGLLTTGPHLHLEVIVNGEHIDPLTVLPPLSR